MKLCISTSISNFNLLLQNNKGENFSKENNLIMESNPIDLLTELLEEVNKDVKDINEIYVDIGPGGTSSIRTGVAISNALSYALAVPSFPVLSSELIYSYAVKQDPDRNWIVLSRSIKGHVYCFHNNQEEHYLKKLSYGLLPEVMNQVIGNKNENIGIITDIKTERDIKSQFPNLENSTYRNDLYKVNIKHFGSICEDFKHREVSFPKIVIPVTENQIINE